MTEEQKIQELLKPRYKVIALWPYCDESIGIILTPYPVERKLYMVYPEGQQGFILPSDKNRCTSAFYDQFPHLFKRLEWWEERDASEMPEYYKYSGTHGVYKTQFQPNGGIIMLDFKPTETVPCKLSDCLPATAADYRAYTEYLNYQSKTV